MTTNSSNNKSMGMHLPKARDNTDIIRMLSSHFTPLVLSFAQPTVKIHVPSVDTCQTLAKEVIPRCPEVKN